MATKAKNQHVRPFAAVAAPAAKVGGFMNFIREQGVVGLAVGLAIGTAAGDTVKACPGIYRPTRSARGLAQQGLQAASFTVNVGDRSGEFALGCLCQL